MPTKQTKWFEVTLEIFFPFISLVLTMELRFLITGSLPLDAQYYTSPWVRSMGHATHEHASPLIPRFPIYEERSCCIVRTF